MKMNVHDTRIKLGQLRYVYLFDDIHRNKVS